MVRSAVIVAALAGLSGCADDDVGASIPDVAGPAYAGRVRVSAIDNTFRPETLKVVAGATVVWSNDGRNDHNVLPSDGSTDYGVEVDDFLPGETYEQSFSVPGAYRYYCSIHATPTAGSMRGTIVVTDPATTPETTIVD